MIVMQIHKVRLKQSAANDLSIRDYNNAKALLERINWQIATEAVISTFIEECVDMLRDDLTQLIHRAFLVESVKPEHFEFEVTSQEVRNGRFWMPSHIVRCHWISVKDYDMKKVKVKDLHGKALVWAMCILEGFGEEVATYTADTVGTKAFNLGELIEWHKIGILPPDGHRGSQWMAFLYRRGQHDLTMAEGIQDAQFGGTPLDAVLRCILAHHVGKEVEVPEELL